MKKINKSSLKDLGIIIAILLWSSLIIYVYPHSDMYHLKDLSILIVIGYLGQFISVFLLFLYAFNYLFKKKEIKSLQVLCISCHLSAFFMIGSFIFAHLFSVFLLEFSHNPSISNLRYYHLSQQLNDIGFNYFLPIFMMSLLWYIVVKFVHYVLSAPSI